MFGLRPIEIILIVGLILVLFGVGRIGKLGGELGEGIKSFKDALTGKKSNDEEITEIKPEQKTDDKSE